MLRDIRTLKYYTWTVACYVTSARWISAHAVSRAARFPHTLDKYTKRRVAALKPRTPASSYTVKGGREMMGRCCSKHHEAGGHEQEKRARVWKDPSSSSRVDRMGRPEPASQLHAAHNIRVVHTPQRYREAAAACGSWCGPKSAAADVLQCEKSRGQVASAAPAPAGG